MGRLGVYRWLAKTALDATRFADRARTRPSTAESEGSEEVRRPPSEGSANQFHNRRGTARRVVGDGYGAGTSSRRGGCPRPQRVRKYSYHRRASIRMGKGDYEKYDSKPPTSARGCYARGPRCGNLRNRCEAEKGRHHSSRLASTPPLVLRCALEFFRTRFPGNKSLQRP